MTTIILVQENKLVQIINSIHKYCINIAQRQDSGTHKIVIISSEPIKIILWHIRFNRKNYNLCGC